MVSPPLRKGSLGPTRTVHRLAGHINPRCQTCGRTPMRIQASPFELCVTPAPRLPFEGEDRTDMRTRQKPLTTAAVTARRAICDLAIARQADPSLQRQLRAELADEIRQARAAERQAALPSRATGVAKAALPIRQRARA